jgi:hypothetical protein
MLEGEHCCEGVTGAAAIDVILNGEKPADPPRYLESAPLATLTLLLMHDAPRG